MRKLYRPLFYLGLTALVALSYIGCRTQTQKPKPQHITQEQRAEISKRLEEKLLAPRSEIEKEIDNLDAFCVVETAGMAVFRIEDSAKKYLKEHPGSKLAYFGNKQKMLRFLKDRNEGKNPKIPESPFDGYRVIRGIKHQDLVAHSKKMDRLRASPAWNFPYYITNSGKEIPISKKK